MKLKQFAKKLGCWMLSASMLAGAILPYAPAKVQAAPTENGTAQLRVAVLSDTHYYPLNYVNHCEDFKTYTDGDPKLLEESGSIIDAALDAIAEDKPDMLLVTGDITKDGELQGEQDMAEKFRKLEQVTGGATQVFVVNGNHDIYNYQDACTYQNGHKENVTTTTPEDFREIYKEFGYDETQYETEFFQPKEGKLAGGLSYRAVYGNYVILALDSGRYSPDAETGYTTNEHITAGRVDEDLLDWAEQKVKEANAEGKTVIGIMHHALIPHFEGEENLMYEYVVDNWKDVAERLGNAGLRYIFTGHMHANDIAEYTTIAGHHITDLETGSLSACILRSAGQ